MRKKKMYIIFSILSFTAFLVVLNSVIFSCRNVSAFCVNYADGELESEVLSYADIAQNQSIFFLPEDKIKERIESNLPSVTVINTERIFTNTVIIHFAKILDYLALPYGSGYVVANNLGKVTAIEQSVDLDSLILVRMRGELSNPAVNQAFEGTIGGEREVISAVLSALDRLEYRERDRIQLLKEIDITNPEFISLRTRTGVRIVIIGTDDLLQKMQYAVSLYVSSDTYKNSGTITAFKNNQDGKISVTYEAG